MDVTRIAASCFRPSNVGTGVSSQPDYAPSGSAAPEIDGPSDAELISAVRAGDMQAYGTLFARHADSARRLARQLVSAGDVDDLVSEAFSKVLGVLQRGGGPDLAFRAYLLTSLRRLHVDKIRASSRLTTTDDLTPYDPGVPFNDTVVSGFENATAAKAFASLPERWQQVLWHTEVEGQKPADIAPLLGMSANSVSALAYRAREGLRQAFVTMHANDAAEDTCAAVRGELGAYIRGGTSRRTSMKIEEHLSDCRECTAIYLELTEVNSHLGAILAPALLGTAGAGYLAAAHGIAAKGVLVGIGHWLWNTPAGKATSVGGGVAAAGVAVAVAVAAASGSPAPAPVVAAPQHSVSAAPSPKPSPPASKPAIVVPPRPTVTPAVATPRPTPTPTPSPTPKPTPAGPQIVHPPVSVTAPPSGSVTIDLTAGIKDPVGGLHVVKAVAAHGTISIATAKRAEVFFRAALARTSPAGSVTYTAHAGWKGADVIRYTVADADGRTISGSVTVTTLDAAPTAPAVSATAPAAWVNPATTPIAVLATASDPNGDPVSLAAVGQAAHGTVTITPDGQAAYTPNAGYGSTASTTATDTFSYTVSDGTLTSTGTVTVTLGMLPDRAPIAPDVSASTAYMTAVSFDLPATDPDGDPLAVTFNGVPSSAISVTGLHATYTPPAGFSGTARFSYTVTDPGGLSSQGAVNVTVAPEPATVSITGNPHGNILDLQVDAVPAGGALLTVTFDLLSLPSQVVTVESVTADTTTCSGIGTSTVSCPLPAGSTSVHIRVDSNIWDFHAAVTR